MKKHLSLSSSRRILDAAEELFAQQGFEGTSLREISLATGLNTSLISYYFGSKHGLYEAIVELRLADFRLAFNQLQLANDKPGMDLFLSAYISWFSGHKHFFRLINREFSSTAHTAIKQLVSETLEAHFLQMRDILRLSSASSSETDVAHGSDDSTALFLYLITYGLLQAYIENSPIYQLASNLDGVGKLSPEKIKSYLAAVGSLDLFTPYTDI